MNCLERAKKMNQLMAEGKVMEAFETFYHDDVRVIEVPTNEVREGKGAQRKAIEQWNEMVKEMNDGGVDAITSDEDSQISMVESWMDVTFKDGTRTKMGEVAVQKWKDGQIIEEKFYYHNPMAQQENR